MNQKILKCIPSLLASGAVAQAANMVNVVKASFDVSQEYKDTVCNLPQHFITHMLDLYKDAMYSISECAMVGSDKDTSIINIEKTFIENSEKTTKVLDNKANMLSALRNALSSEYDRVIATNEPTVLEKSIITTAATNDTINKMVEYVKLLKPEERLAMIYALGIASYVDSSISTASTDQITSEELESAIDDKLCIYPIAEISKKVKENMLSHKFNCDDIEYDVLYNVVDNISSKTIIEICDEVKNKLCINYDKDITNIDELFDCLDKSGEELTSKIGLPAHIVFIALNDNICMVCAFSKEDVNTIVSTQASNKPSFSEDSREENIKVFGTLTWNGKEHKACFEYSEDSGFSYTINPKIEELSKSEEEKLQKIMNDSLWPKKSKTQASSNENFRIIDNEPSDFVNGVKQIITELKVYRDSEDLEKHVELRKSYNKLFVLLDELKEEFENYEQICYRI